uniref:tRNA (uracil-O(2)-)-methyltransferase n=1 Tax=Panagrolaimus sp. JU765 TaxID=591449 RepID=A0AC34QDB8_9BILA
MGDNKFERYSMLNLQNPDRIQAVLAAGIPSCSFEYPIGTTCLPLKDKDSSQYIQEAERIADIFFKRTELVIRQVSGSVEITKNDAMEALELLALETGDAYLDELKKFPWDSFNVRFHKFFRRAYETAFKVFVQAEIKLSKDDGVYFVYLNFIPVIEASPLFMRIVSCLAIEKNADKGLQASFCVISPVEDSVKSVLPDWCGNFARHFAYYLDTGKRVEVDPPLRLIDQNEYYEKLMKIRESSIVKELSKKWNDYERTDKSKHLFEDVGTVAYLATMFQQMKMNQINFVDIGCGNGVNTFLLNSLFGDAIKGIGYDVKARKIWKYYEENGMTNMLKAQGIEPNWPNLEQSFPAETNFLIGLHTDEMTQWNPWFAMICRCNFFILPCCPYDFYGKFHLSKGQRGNSKWPYLDHISRIAKSLGYDVNIDMLKIPSQKKTAIIGTIPENGKLLMDTDNWQEVVEKMLLPSLKANGRRGFVVRSNVEIQKNCSQIKHDVRDLINESIVTILLQKDPQEGCCLQEIAEQLPEDITKHLKAQNKGLQTFIKINKGGYVLERGHVWLRTDIWPSYRLPKILKFPCFFDKFIPGGCKFRDVCGCLHADMEVQMS